MNFEMFLISKCQMTFRTALKTITRLVDTLSFLSANTDLLVQELCCSFQTQLSISKARRTRLKRNV